MADEPRRVLVVDDDAALAESITMGLNAAGYDASFLTTGAGAEQRIRTGDYDALITDLRLGSDDGMRLMALSRSLHPERPMIAMTAFSAIDSAIESIRQGAYHYLTKPFRVAELALFLARAFEDCALRKEARELRAAFGRYFSLENVVAKSARMQEACAITARVAASSVPVLITGETGSGKGMIARAIHQHGDRRRKPFVTVNCAALPEPLLESELFGHKKGAFTGADSTRDGLFVQADGGTLFLDEIGEMSAPLQAKLLDVIERGAVRALGSDKERKIDTRIVCATHRDLQSRVDSGAFRQDLLYRINVIVIDVPSLRHRREDIAPLAERFLAAARERTPQSPVRRLPPPLLHRLLDYEWPGNVRELAHVIERLVILGDAEDASEAQLSWSKRSAPEFSGEILTIRALQRRYAAWALDQCGGRKMLTCEKLGIDPKTLSAWLEQT